MLKPRLRDSKKRKAGRRSKLLFLDVKLIMALYSEGMTDKQVAKIVKVSERSLNNWKLTNKQFMQLHARAKEYSTDAVVNRLWQLCMGWKGHRPDRESIMHWLYNRDPKNWRRRNELSIGAQYNNPDAKPIEIKQELAGIVGIDLKKIPTELLEQFEKCLNG